ncbi:carboxypeptidase-like regulatory domain-containing protein [Psychroserpens damuponensis]|uniref:carboxypeptidase-like regulatory domain-containing protein n=1 Tax=Psychroserpens damuponensis TaxID=943936 RepID=UPI00058C4169|nr:carboxypeptidase-like regulatory domain-containing protein [Psychroserpens damuponensis]
MKITKIFLLASVLLCFFSCNNDDNLNTPQNQDDDPNHIAFSQNFGSEISRTFLGTVVDTNNNPIENATISIGSLTTTTDANGVFIINNATINQRFGYVKAQKAGFIHASRAVVPSEGTNKVRIMMLAETIAGTTSNGTEETITLQNGASVALDGNYIKPDGSSYSGNVNVIMHHLDPANEDMQDQMPGMLYAANSQNEERMLQTYGMLAVELRGDNGEDLNLAEGSTAEITMPLDPSLMATAPSSIPLWYFDEAYGYWVEDGAATLVGNAYVGTVSHFSFWNCDIPAEAVNLCVTIKDENDNLLSGLYAEITSTQFGTTGGVTNQIGTVCGLIPTNESLVLNVYSSYENTCTNALYNGTIGPFSSDSSINIVTSDLSGEWITETVTGNFTDCNDNPVTEGYVRLFKAFTLLDTDFVENGDFELSTVRCNTSSDIFKLHGVDYINAQDTDSISFTYTSPITNVGTIAACNAVDEFVTYQVDGGDTVTEYFGIQGGQDGLSNLNFSYYNNGDESGNNFSIGIFNEDNSPITVGVYPPANTNYLSFQDGTNGTAPNSAGSNTLITVNVSEIGEVGAYIDLTFNGTYTDADLIEHTITGTVHALRDY